MLAVDTNLTISGKNYFELQNSAYHDLENIRGWLLANKLLALITILPTLAITVLLNLSISIEVLHIFVKCRPCLCGLGYPRQPSTPPLPPPCYPGRANFSLKSLKDSADRLYDPA